MNQMTQIAGTHYSKMAIQPRVMAIRNGWDADAFSILKYLSRYESKNGIEDLRKALHFAVMRREEKLPHLSAPVVISMADYCVRNGFHTNTPLCTALYSLNYAVYHLHEEESTNLIESIENLISTVEATAPIG